MKNILQALILFVLVGFSTNSHSQVILNGGSFESIIIDSDYTVPDGKTLIVTHHDGHYLNVNGRNWDQADALQHVPLPAGTEIDEDGGGWSYNQSWVAGYLINNDGSGVGTDDPDDEFNSDGGIEIYPNPTDDLASVFVDYQGDWNMTVYDLNGQIVFECQSDTPVKSIDTNSLSAGTYIVSVRAKRKLIGSSQLIVQ